MRNLIRNKQFETYDSIIKYNLGSGIIEEVDKNFVSQGKE